VTVLSRTATLGISARETASGTYQVPVWAIPFTKATFNDVIGEIKDESVRGDDSVLHGMYQGVTSSTWDIDISAYPDLLGVLLRGMIGPDTITAGVSTTLAAAIAVGANSFESTVTIPAGQTGMVDTGAAVEYFTTGTPTGSGPYTIPVTAVGAGTTFQNIHASGAAVVMQSTHLFKQSPTTLLPTWSLTVFDGLVTLGYSYARMSDVQIKIDPKAAVTANLKLTAFPSAPQSSVTEPYNSYQPFLGWQWNMTNGGASSTRGVSFDATLKRATEAINGSTGTQAPREVFAAALEMDAQYKAIYENQLDYNLYLSYAQLPSTVNLTQPLAFGGMSVVLTMSQSGYSKGTKDLSGNYVMANFDVSGIKNTTDNGIVQATLKNFYATAY
jgi:hypothetical protein